MYATSRKDSFAQHTSGQNYLYCVFRGLIAYDHKLGLVGAIVFRVEVLPAAFVGFERYLVRFCSSSFLAAHSVKSLVGAATHYQAYCNIRAHYVRVSF